MKNKLRINQIQLITDDNTLSVDVCNCLSVFSLSLCAKNSNEAQGIHSKHATAITNMKKVDNPHIKQSLCGYANPIISNLVW